MPGPGKGWRLMKASGTPSSRPMARTCRGSEDGGGFETLTLGMQEGWAGRHTRLDSGAARSLPPSLAPLTRARTSSLNSSLKGSMSLNCRSLGRPPTLWWLLMVWLCFWPLPGGGHDSMTSG
jgi:hypothetical protein